MTGIKIEPEEIRRRFRGVGLKVTPQRMAIYRALVETTRHPTAEDLFKQVVRRHPMISPNTVYYTLSALQRSGLVCEVNYFHDRVRYDGNMTPHHHLVCMGCRSIQDLADEALDDLSRIAANRRGFQVLGHRVEFHGYCAACRKERQGESDPRSAHRSSSKGGHHGEESQGHEKS